MLKTKQYDMFKFREDNREKLDNAHVKRLACSIEARNLLEFRPILVNKDMEIIDGQHRLLAAKSLSIHIYYEIEKSLTCHEVILMNTVKIWSKGDYLNYYCHNGYEHYIKLREFIKKHSLSLRVALNILMGESKNKYHEFKEGKFVFLEDFAEEELEACWDTINYIQKMNGFSSYTNSGRFWKALLKLIRHPVFDKAKWKSNLSRMVERFGPRARTEDYLMLMMEIYNYKNLYKINILQDF